MKTTAILMICLIVLSLGIMIYYNIPEKKSKQIELTENKFYQGAVPEGYDLNHFRKTGITKPLE